MDNKSYFEYIKPKSFETRLREFGDAVQEMTRCSCQASEYASRGSWENSEYYQKECKSQLERANWLFKNLITEHEKIMKSYKQIPVIYSTGPRRKKDE